MKIATLVRVPQRVLQGAVRSYRLLLKPWLGNACRFEPTCSAYALQALERHGAVRGAALGGWRVLRCNPWCDGGCDPVPHNFVFAPARRPGPPEPTEPLEPMRQDGTFNSPQTPVGALGPTSRKHP